jgi:peptidoglycan/xylan/chitin deacetylase (PgdA/CDA1 family)
MSSARLLALLCGFGLFAIAGYVQAQSPQIAFTWDDLPAHSTLPANTTRVEIGRKITAAMKAAHLPPVYGFVNGVQFTNEPLSEPMLREWREGGMLLGNHTWSHMDLNKRTVEDWEADVLKNEPVLEKYAAGSDWHWLRYPFLSEGETPEKRAAARKFLAEHGYKIAAVTMSFSDYAYNDPYARCVAKKDDAGISQLKTEYLKMADAEIDYARGVAKAMYGRDIPYVLLMHVGALDAEMLPRLLDLYKARGFEFVSLEEAEKDPVYASDRNPALPEPGWKAPMSPIPPRPKQGLDLNAICK